MQIFVALHVSATCWSSVAEKSHALFQFFLTDKKFSYDKYIYIYIKIKKKKSHKRIGGQKLLHEIIYADLQQIKLKVQEAA